MKSSMVRRSIAGLWAALLAFGLGFLPGIAQAITVKTVPWVATNPLIPHDSWSGKSITLKGTADVQGATIQYTWDFGDGSPVATGTVTNMYAIEAKHAYTGSAGQIFTARLTVQNTATGDSANKVYLVKIENKSLAVEVNVAIDEGLWYLHKNQRRTQSGGIDYGDWLNTSSWYGVTAANINAFEVNGHLEVGNADNPYVDTVKRGMRSIFTWLIAESVPIAKSIPIPPGTVNPDTNGDGRLVRLNQSNPVYQSGMFMDVIVASGTPSATASTGPANIVGRTYKDIVQNISDYYIWCQYPFGPQGGGWRYSCQQAPDNSVNQWAAIGFLAAERSWGITVPQIVKDWNKVWLDYSQNRTTNDGAFGYTDRNLLGSPWGPYADTASGMVQLAWVGIGRGTNGIGYPNWDKAEAFMRDHFASTGTLPYNNIKHYYYALFSYTKSMLLHDSNGDGIAEPIKFMQSSAPGVSPIDWYAAETDPSQPPGINNTNGVARTLINDQLAAGNWTGNDPDGNQYAFETAWAIMMLNRTVFSSGVPVAVAKAIPNPGVVGQLITLDGSDSFHQDAGKAIDSWEWDLDNDGTYDDASGPTATRSYAALGDYPAGLRVCDNATPETCATTTVTVRITTPPIAPTANANGPYVFCPQAKPWFLDGTGSINPDQGQSEPGMPGDTIQSYAWDLDGDGQFDDAAGPTPDVTAFYTQGGAGGYIAQLRATDTTATSFPSSGFGDLSSTSAAQVTVKASTDPACGCVSNLAARPKSGKVQLVWTFRPGAHHYNIYRGTISGGPYLKIGSTTSAYATYLDAAVVNGTTYYYVVREAALNGDELCQSNQASATPTLR